MEKDLTQSELYEECYRFQERRSNVRFVAWIAVLFLFVCCVRMYWVKNFGGVQVDGASMCNTLQDEEQLLMKYVKDAKEAKRGDVIVVYVGDYAECASVTSGYLIKRLIAIEGDTVRCIDGQVSIKYAGAEEYVNVDEPYAYYRTAQLKVDYDFGPYKVGKGEIFFLGDNRNNSMDSRYEEEKGSHLKNRLYKAKDIFGIVPDWAIKHQKILEKIFFN